MTALVSIFGGSLLLTSCFFAFKDWERQRGDTRITAFLKRHSPRAEFLFRTIVARCAFFIHTVVATVRALVLFGFHRALTFFRAGVVVVGAHMIHVARGERLMAEGKIPSTYFKLLHRHKEKINGTDIPEGIAKPDVMRKVKIRTQEDMTGVEAQPQVE